MNIDREDAPGPPVRVAGARSRVSCRDIVACIHSGLREGGTVILIYHSEIRVSNSSIYVTVTTYCHVVRVVAFFAKTLTIARR